MNKAQEIFNMAEGKMNRKQSTIARRIIKDGDGNYERTMDFCEENCVQRLDDWLSRTTRYQFRDGSVIDFDGPCFNLVD